MQDVGEHGQGGITKRKDGRLQVAITLPSGKRIYRTIPRMSDPRRQRRMAEDARREMVARREADLDPQGQILSDFLLSWLDRMANMPNARLRPNTLTGYRIIANRHLLPVLGKTPLDRLSVRIIQGWIDGLTVSPQYVAHCHAFLRRVLNVAVKQQLIADNPARHVELPPVAEYRASPMTATEVHQLLAATATDRLGALWRLAAVTGLRSGELLALSWDDIDLERGMVTVTARLAREGGAWVRVPPKADRDLERLAIDSGTVRVLEAHRVRQAAERQPEWPYWGLVFVTPGGYPIDRHAAMAEFRGACDRAGIARRRVHDIRHSSGTIMRDLGIDRETRKARLGHSTDKMAARYSRASEAQDRAAVERLAEAIG